MNDRAFGDTPLIERYARNREGRDFVVGDIHGHFTRLESALSDIGFDAGRDRLFSVGDLVDRGPESERALEWLDYPWFHPVRGNHEDYAIRHTLTGRVDLDNYRRNGGGWLIDMEPGRKPRFGLALARLPYAIEVDTPEGLVGIVHADSPVDDWRDLAAALRQRRGREYMLWSRLRLKSRDSQVVRNVHRVIAGHTPVDHVTQLGNVLHIDTAGWSEGRFTLLELDKLP